MIRGERAGTFRLVIRKKLTFLKLLFTGFKNSQLGVSQGRHLSI